MDMNQLRVEALKRLMGDLTQAEFADRHDINASYLSQIMSGHRSFGERAASNMERKIGLQPGTLSRPALGDAGGHSQSRAVVTEKVEAYEAAHPELRRLQRVAADLSDEQLKLLCGIAEVIRKSAR